MRFEKALTEEEIIKSLFLEDGEYSYNVIKSTEKPSQTTGKDYIALELVVWDKLGKERLIFCNLWSMKLIKHFCDVNNMQADYESCEIPDYKFLNKTGGKVIIGYEPEKPNPKGGIYKAKNVVLDFVKDKEKETIIQKDIDHLNAEFKDDDVLF